MNNLDKTMAVAQGALEHHGVKAVLVDQNQECYLPKDLMLATVNWTKSIFTFDGKTLRCIEPEEGRKLTVTAEGKQLIGVGKVVGKHKEQERLGSLAEETFKRLLEQAGEQLAPATDTPTPAVALDTPTPAVALDTPTPAVALDTPTPAVAPDNDAPTPPAAPAADTPKVSKKPNGK